MTVVEKAKKEFQQYKETLSTMPSEYVLMQASEYVAKQEIILQLTEMKYIPTWLKNIECPLESLYQMWLDSDYNPGTMYREFLCDIIEENL